MKKKELYQLFRRNLQTIYSRSEAEAVIREVFLFLFRDDIKKVSFPIFDQEVPPACSRKWKEVLARLQKHEPVQYITGKAVFMDFDFRVNRHVLIPRPETEELTHWIITELKILEKNRSEPLNILDIGSGSGCIAIALKKNLKNAVVNALDISEHSLAVAKSNATDYNVDLNFICADILQFQTSESYDVVVSNPPYITLHEKKSMEPHVTGYEPRHALFVEGRNPVLFYERIIAMAAGSMLRSSGRLYFELNPQFAEAIAGMVKDAPFKEVHVREDMSGKNRMLRAVKK